MLIPKSISKELSSLDQSALQEVKSLVERLIFEKEQLQEPEQPPEPVPGRDREVLEFKGSGSVTYRLERVPCGKNCKGCPHGPYWYGYWREGKRTRSKYIGKSLSGMR